MAARETTTGLILAGGRSRRFGADKALHPLHGRPMIEHVYRALAPLVAEVLVSDRPPGRDFGLPVEVVLDRYEEAGPLGGLHAGLSRCRTPQLLVVACDMPFLTREVLARLLEAPADPGACVVARTPDGFLQPLCARYPVSLRPVVETLLGEGRRAVRELLARAPRVEVAVPPEALRNVNRPEELGPP